MISIFVCLLSVGMDKIEELQNHQNGEIYKLAFHIIDTYFSDNVCIHTLQTHILCEQTNALDTRYKRTHCALLH